MTILSCQARNFCLNEINLWTGLRTIDADLRLMFPFKLRKIHNSPFPFNLNMYYQYLWLFKLYKIMYPKFNTEFAAKYQMEITMLQCW